MYALEQKVCITKILISLEPTAIPAWNVLEVFSTPVQMISIQFHVSFRKRSRSLHILCDFKFCTDTLTKHHNQAALYWKCFYIIIPPTDWWANSWYDVFFPEFSSKVVHSLYLIFMWLICLKDFSNVAHEQQSLFSVQIIRLVRCSIIAITKPLMTSLTVMLIFDHMFLHRRVDPFSEKAVLKVVELYYNYICTILVPDL